MALGKKYAGMLAEMKIDALVPSSGNVGYALFNTVRGEVPAHEFTAKMPFLKRHLVKFFMKQMNGKFDCKDEYHLDFAKEIKPVIGNIPYVLVGGARKLSRMNEIVESGQADFIAMSRPFIREPGLVNKFKEGKQDESTCISCNKCLAAVLNSIPVNCYKNGIPAKFLAVSPS